MFKAKSSHVLAFIPVIVALMVGVMQIYLAFSQGLSAWQVGGFGMFARPDMKYLRVYVDDAPFDPTINYDRLSKKIDTLPTYANLQMLANIVACDVGKDTRVELWRGHFDAEKQAVEFKLEITLEQGCD